MSALRIAVILILSRLSNLFIKQAVIPWLLRLALVTGLLSSREKPNLISLVLKQSPLCSPAFRWFYMGLPLYCRNLWPNATSTEERSRELRAFPKRCFARPEPWGYVK